MYSDCISVNGKGINITQVSDDYLDELLDLKNDCTIQAYHTMLKDRHRRWEKKQTRS